MLELEHGAVKWFNNDKQFGFLEVLNEDDQKTGEELFFHMGDGQWVDIIDDEIRWVGPDFTGAAYPISANAPQIGTVLAFERAAGKGGKQKASPWTIAEAYDNRVRKLTEPFYRVIQDTRFGTNEVLDPRDTQKIIWEGQGGNAMATQYPIRVLDGKLDDPLSEWADKSAGSKTHYFFEILVKPHMTNDPDCPPEGYWLPCMRDPRPRSDMAREMESASESAS